MSWPPAPPACESSARSGIYSFLATRIIAYLGRLPESGAYVTTIGRQVP